MFFFFRVAFVGVVLLISSFGAVVFSQTNATNNYGIIAQAIQSAVVSHENQPSSSAVQVDVLYVPKKFQQMAITSADIKIKLNPKIKVIKGKLVVPCYVSSSKYNVQALIKVFRDVLVAANDIKSRQLIESSLLRWQRYDISLLPDIYFTDIQRVDGMETTVPIRQDAVVLSWMLRQPPLVKKGSLVEIVAQVDGVTVKCAGKLLEDGKKDSPVYVENMGSHKRLKGNLITNSTVLVDVIE